MGLIKCKSYFKNKVKGGLKSTDQCCHTEQKISGNEKINKKNYNI